MYNLSTHCDVPYTGALLIVGVLIIVTVVSLLFRRYKKKQDRIKQKLRLDLYRQRQLVKTKQTDINLLTCAWKLCPTEVKLREKIAQGAYGEVWKGALHDRWVVAIKKLFPTASSQTGKIMLKKKNKTKSSLRSRKSAAQSELFRDGEVKFLMRTRHERLVMFLGCGIAEDGTGFLVTEFMDGGSLDRALWAGGNTSMCT